MPNAKTLTGKCSVCSAPAAPYPHYGAIVCFSDRAFFRRSIRRKYDCLRTSGCQWVNDKLETKYWCKKCRLDKCLQAGMMPKLVDRRLANLKNQKENRKDKVFIQVPEKLYKCPFDPCSYYSSYYEDVSVHWSQKHTSTKLNPMTPFQNIQETMGRHPITNLKITKYISVTKPAFEATKQNNQSESLVCKYCSHQALDTLDLKYHLMDHFDAGEVSKEDVLTFLHGCQQCDYVASNQNNLNLHMQLIHNYYLPVTDLIVDKTDKTFSNFKCALCNFRARYEDDVKNHFETYHNNQANLDETDEAEFDVKTHFEEVKNDQATLDEVDEAEFDEICDKKQF